MSESQRNFLILILIAVAGSLLYGPFSIGAGAVGYLFNALFVIALGVFMFLAYRRHEGTINDMEPQWRALLLGSGVLLYFVYFTGSLYPHWAGGFGNDVLFFALLAASGYGMYYAWQKRSGFRW